MTGRHSRKTEISKQQQEIEMKMMFGDGPKQGTPSLLIFEGVWECGSGCFSNSFSCRNTCQ